MTPTTCKTHATTENGIVTLYDTNGQGDITGRFSVPVGDIPARLDKGEWDDDQITAFCLIEAWMESPLNVDSRLVHRWLVASTWIAERCASDETHYFSTEDDADGFHYVVYLTPESARRTLAESVEIPLAEKYGDEEGNRRAIAFYQRMLKFTNSPPSLSDSGLQYLTGLYTAAARASGECWQTLQEGDDDFI
ncbi:hypothetical protein RF20_09900 [Salmonella enterica]|nr:hypothetical protein [Salmonella enterica]EAX7072254.1 hypothetical protein [Salmonella enterica]EBP2219962.1 hypothetical protein [Salmonella enterica]ECH8206075.1 hypothetical protein [Salmonella enterica subsp. enterica]